jgi:hypothetical protein
MYAELYTLDLFLCMLNVSNLILYSLIDSFPLNIVYIHTHTHTGSFKKI